MGEMQYSPSGVVTAKNLDTFYITDSDPSFDAKLNRWIDLQNKIAQAKEDNQWMEIGSNKE